MPILLLRLASLLLLIICAVAALWPVHTAKPFLALYMDALHAPAAALLYCTLRLWLGKTRLRPYLLMAALLLLLGLELLQPLVGRAAQGQDLLNGLLGVALVWCWPQLKPVFRLAAAALIAMVGGRGLLNVWLLQLQLQSAAPDLMVMPLLRSEYGWQVMADSAVSQQQTSTGRWQFAVPLTAAHWQGMLWHNPALDFSAISELCFSAKASQRLWLQVRIDDRQSNDYASRFDSQVQLHPQWQRFCIDVTQLRDKDQRLMDKSQLQYWYFFAKAPAPKAWFSLAQVQLLQP